MEGDHPHEDAVDVLLQLEVAHLLLAERLEQLEKGRYWDDISAKRSLTVNKRISTKNSANQEIVYLKKVFNSCSRRASSSWKLFACHSSFPYKSFPNPNML